MAYIALIVHTDFEPSGDHADHGHVDIAVVGGGASAVLFVAALRHHAGSAMPSVAIIDPSDTVGLGVAYSTNDPSHRLNVRASGLSALVDDPGHFVRWLAVDDPSVPPHGFALRSRFGVYLRQLLAASAGDDVTHVRATVSAVEQRPPGAVVHLDGGGSLTASRVVVAIGVPPTADARFAVDDAVVAAGAYVPDPWAPGAITALADRAPGNRPQRTGVVALVGTGLTSVDVALSLCDAGWNVVAISPHGLLPERHESVPSPARAALVDPPDVVTAASFIHWVRTSCVNEPSGWRAAMDALRFRVDPVWQRTPLEHRRRLVRRVGSVWQRHRHRIAPGVAEAIDELIVQGRLRVERGRVVGVAAHPDHPQMLVQRVGPGGEPMDNVPADAVVNCAGAPGVHTTTSALTRTLLNDGVLVADGLGMGVEVDPVGRAMGIDGAASSVVTVIGALRRGVEAEAIAIPDLRVHADTAARRLLNELGVSGTPVATSKQTSDQPDGT